MSKYIEMNLVKVDDNGSVNYYAVFDKTFDGMMMTKSALSYTDDEKVRNIKMQYIGNVLVEQAIFGDDDE